MSTLFCFLILQESTKLKAANNCIRANITEQVLQQIHVAGISPGLPSKSKLPKVLRARVMLVTSWASARLDTELEMGIGDVGLLGAPGCLRGLPISTMDSILSRPS